MISLTAILSWLELSSEAAQDAILQRLIDGATAAVGRELGRYLGPPVETTEVHRTQGSRLVLLHDVPSEGSTFVVESRVRPGDAWETVSSTDYAVDGRGLRFGYHQPFGWVRVTYTHGFTVDEGPTELADLIRDLVTEAWTADASSDLQSERLGDYSYTRAQVTGTVGWEAVVRGWRFLPV